MSDEPKTSEGERLIKLTLYVKEHAPVDFASIRSGLHEYGYAKTDDDAQRQRHDNKVRRMFERDKATLESCGIFIVADAENRYMLDQAASFAAPVDLTGSEASLLRLACAALLEDDAYPFKTELRMALVKIGDELEVPDLLPNMELANVPNTGEDARLKKVRKAIRTRKRLGFSYEDAHARASERLVEPFGCLVLRGRCYVVAHDPNIGEARMFRLDRMTGLHVNGAHPTVPDFEPRRFDPQDYYGLPFQFGDEEAFRAQVACCAEDGWRLRRLSMQRGSFAEEAERVVWSVEAKSARALAQWCIENGPGFVPVAPAEALAAYRATLEAALAGHEGGAR